MALGSNRVVGTSEGAESRRVMRDWFESLADYKAKSVVVLGPDPFAANDKRNVVAVYPGDFKSAAQALARSHDFGVNWRLNGGSLVSWKNLATSPTRTADERWVAECLQRGVLSIVRTEIPMPFGQGFECFVFAGRQLADKSDAATIVWSAMSVWPLIKEDIVAAHFEISPRERQILMVLAEGLTAKDAGKRVGCTERTVTFHLSNLMEKLRADNRAAAIQRACSLGLI